mgnify:CR=1 FL=1
MNMEELLAQESLPDIQERTTVKGKVIQVNRDEAYVDIGYKQEIAIPKRELAYPAPESAEDVVKVGDVIDVYVVSLGGDNGGILSKVKADRMVAWTEMEKKKEAGETVQANITQVVKGGLVASVDGLRGFIPASQMELHFVKDLSIYVGQTVEAEIIEIDVHKQRLVLSRRALLEAEREKKEAEVFSTLEAGQTVRGTVKRLVDYGAFIDIGGVDALHTSPTSLGTASSIRRMSSKSARSSTSMSRALIRRASASLCPSRTRCVIRGTTPLRSTAKARSSKAKSSS